MRIAIIVAQTAQGLSTVALSGDLDALRAQFRALRGAGSLRVGDQDATCAWYFDTSGRQARKQLAPESSVNAVDTANGAESTRVETQARAQAAAEASRKIAAQARTLAEETVGFVAQRLSGAVPPPPPVAQEIAPEDVALDDPFAEPPVKKLARKTH